MSHEPSDRELVEKLQRNASGWGILALRYPTDARFAVLAAFEAARRAYARGEMEEPGGPLFRWLAQLQQLPPDGTFLRTPIATTLLRFCQDVFSGGPEWAPFVLDDGSELEILERELARYAARELAACDAATRVGEPLGTPAMVGAVDASDGVDMPAAAPRARPVRPYADTERYDVGDRLTHPRFGEGVVERVSPGKIVARFEVGTKTLVGG